MRLVKGFRGKKMDCFLVEQNFRKKMPCETLPERLTFAVAAHIIELSAAEAA